MQSLTVNGYTETQVKIALHSSNRKLNFKYYILDKNNNYKSTLSYLLEGSIANDFTANIQRTATFKLNEGDAIDYLNDRIQPWIGIKMFDGNYAWFAQGIFLLSSPTRKTDITGKIVLRDIDAYDQCQILSDTKVEARYTVTSGANYITTIASLLTSAGITSQNLTACISTLPADQDWDPGVSYLDIINALLSAITYNPIWFNEVGQAIAQPYILPTSRSTDYTYSDDMMSVIFPDAEQTMDLFGVPNRWIMVVSEADQSTLTSSYTNDNPSSLTSTVSRGRTITSFQTVTAADQTSLDAKVKAQASSDSQVYDTVTMNTAIMPMHSNNDMLQLNYSTLGVTNPYQEIKWSMDLKAGAQMKHSIRRAVSF